MTTYRTVFCLNLISFISSLSTTIHVDNTGAIVDVIARLTGAASHQRIATGFKRMHIKRHGAGQHEQKAQHNQVAERLDGGQEHDEDELAHVHQVVERVLYAVHGAALGLGDILLL